MPSSGQKAASLYREGPTTMVVENRFCSRRALSRLEPCESKGSRTVPRGEGGRKAILLPDELLYKHLINYTPSYVREELEEQPLVGNPELRELKKQRAGLVGELNRLKIELADPLLPAAKSKRQSRARNQKEVLDDIIVVEGKILLADQQLEALPSEVRFDEAHAGEKLLKLNHEKKRFLDCINRGLSKRPLLGAF
jgi:hypothetical protein